MKRSIVLLACVAVLVSSAASPASAKSVPGSLADYKIMVMPTEPSNPPEIGRWMFQSAVQASQDTFVLGSWQFDNGGAPDAQGWTAHDVTEEPTYFHVAGSPGSCDPISPIAGTKSMWCGVWPTSADPWCGWVSLPGYGNSWDQSLEAQGVSTLSYSIEWDTEPYLDFAYLEWWDSANHTWVSDNTVNGDLGFYTGTGSLSESVTSPYGSTKVRIHFVSDGGWSDEDGLAPTVEGAVKVDNLSIDGGPIEDWEDEACGALQSSDGTWVAAAYPAFGLYAHLVHGSDVVQEDSCFNQRSFLWAFFDDPAVTNYACGGWPLQGAVPYGDYLSSMKNQIRSPWIAIAGSGSSFLLEFLTYRDFPDDFVGYLWYVRTRSALGCPTKWKGGGELYNFPGNDWYRHRAQFGPYVGAGDTEIQVALCAYDMCNEWCGPYEPPHCHSHAPLFDQVRVIRFEAVHPQWTVRDYHCWQDNFPEEGGVGPTDYARCDMAMDILPSTKVNILPGDSMVVLVSDPAGLADDNTGGRPGKAVYAFVKVTDRYGTPIPGKSGVAIQSPDNRAYGGEPYTGIPRWPLVAGLTPTGWDAFRMDMVYVRSGSTWKPVVSTYCCDLMDLGSGPTGPHYKHSNENVAANTGIFTPGDVIHYILAAKNINNQWSYMYRTYNGQGSWVRTSDLAEAITSPCEWSVLPDAGRKVGDLGDMLYVDDADDRGGPAQLFFDWAFRFLNFEGRVDRFDVLGPSSAVGNSLASRVKNVQNQLIGDPVEVYEFVLWDCSDLSAALMGDGGVVHGGSSLEKSDDFGMAYTFLDQHPDSPDWAYWGDNVVEDWANLTGTGAVNTKSIYMNHVLVNGDQAAITGTISPRVHPVALSPWVPETFYAYGGCPAVNNFDSVNKQGTAARVSHLYNNDANAPAAVYQTTPNANGTTANFHLAGFGFNATRDDDTVFPPDRVLYLKYLLHWTVSLVPTPTGIDPIAFSNRLENAYPNPFNPTTTIKYSIASSSHISLRIYNAAGQLVRTLVDEEQAPSAEGFAVVWDGTSNNGQTVASGVYFYKLVTEGFSQTKKMAVLK